MSKEPPQIPQELLCINAEKVYDWVILQATIDNNVLAADLGPLPIDPCAPTVSNLTTNCFLADVNGNPLPLNSEIPVTEVGDRKSTRLNSSHVATSYAVFCLKEKRHNRD